MSRFCEATMRTRGSHSGWSSNQASVSALKLCSERSSVSDSNFDWGQGLRELARWQEQQGIAEIDIAYVGTDPLIADLPMRVLPLGEMTVSEVLERTRGRWLAVSATWLYGAYIRDAEVVPYLRGLTPSARTSTFLLFDFTSANP